MPLVLGIDTGGTFTDGVLLDVNTKEVKRKAKAFTTREDLSIGIRNCIDNIRDLDPRQVHLVSLSTTLATNAIVEGRGCRVGLILIGHEPTGDLPAQRTFVVAGGHDIKGAPVAELDLEAVRRAVVDMRGQVDTVAISGYLSIRNPEHEQSVGRMVRELWDVPVICAHQLTTTLGFHERTVTACLNARLLPIIAELLIAVKEVLKEKGIRAPLMVVKGDGSLMSEEITREKPIETLLSGPAASIVGATFLTGSESALALDMGGTTTDIAILERGRPRMNREGATVGGWKTRAEAAEISTFGLGGDSYVQVSPDRKLTIGPKRVWPLAVVAQRFPHLVEELARSDPDRSIIDAQPADCWMLLKKPAGKDRWSNSERQVVEALEDGAHNIFTLAERLGRDPNLLPLKGLEQAQVLGRISFTPTDLLHGLGIFTNYNVAAATGGARILARRLRLDTDRFAERVWREIEAGLCLNVLQSLADREGLQAKLGSEPGAAFVLSSMLAGKDSYGFKTEVHLGYPIVALGAPVSAYLPPVGKILHTQVLIPPHAEVANAVGAASGQVVETLRVLIKPNSGGGFVVHAPWGREAFLNLSEAESYALETAEAVALQNAKRAGAVNPEVLVEKQEVVSHTAGANDDVVFLEMRIMATAVGHPRWEE
ncbi:Hydantoinase/oxoprolinase N-terminal region [Acididesulfobacillus acetoxydans]|uniref:Hydantoinase/oxoprolinase N-terminal region n=1 Tax=Acididesulfobacillus acetoxydans TaxID=1561005 RepID=A0A8S0XB04_9FIRM|nr:hydantoinase/oxoprolinase family protein [Acididesulfobacillus acetoxydans]CAA7600616.1 Hydantoinase/oxoprolinase N-terminal region [Acididesulfobacillus acetoxydans]CEJ09397.1 N-methylhydantoinase A/acetone carboxylase, beta subunit [Acididesulfobacillus acetoxydans]